MNSIILPEWSFNVVGLNYTNSSMATDIDYLAWKVWVFNRIKLVSSMACFLPNLWGMSAFILNKLSRVDVLAKCLWLRTLLDGNILMNWWESSGVASKSVAKHLTIVMSTKLPINDCNRRVLKHQPREQVCLKSLERRHNHYSEYAEPFYFSLSVIYRNNS